MRKLYRSNTNVQIAGVCGGLAEHFDIDPVIIRIIWGLIAICAGTGIVAYLLFWGLVPKKPY